MYTALRFLTMKFKLLFLIGIAALAQPPSGWTPELGMQMKGIGDVVPSPDGSRVVWTHSTFGDFGPG